MLARIGVCSHRASIGCSVFPWSSMCNYLHPSLPASGTPIKRMVAGGILIVPAGLEIPSSFGKASSAPSSSSMPFSRTRLLWSSSADSMYLFGWHGKGKRLFRFLICVDSEYSHATGHTLETMSVKVQVR